MQEISASALFDALYAMPHHERRTARWVMSQKTLDQIKELPEVEKKGPAAGGYLLGKPIKIEPDAEGYRLESLPSWQSLREELATAVPMAADGLIVRPGDVLLVRFDRFVSLEEADRYKAIVLERLPGLADVVLMSGTQGLAVYRPEAS